MKSTPFQMKHSLEFGLKVISKDAKGDVTVQCLSCIHEGWDSAKVGGYSGHKRKATSTIKYFTKPFALDLDHQIFHEAIHSRPQPSNISRSRLLLSTIVAIYINMPSCGPPTRALSNQEKKEYFKNKVKRINTLHQHKDLTADSIEFVILSDIVEMIIGNNSFTMMNRCSMLAIVTMTLWQLRQSQKGPPRSPRRRSMPWGCSSNNSTNRCTRSQSKMSCILN